MGKRRSDARKAKHAPDNTVGRKHEVIPNDRPDCVYLERWLLGVGLGRFWRRATDKSRPAWFTIRLHHFFRSDEDHLHDHPFAFVTLVLKGSYEDWVECPACKGRGQHPVPDLGGAYACFVCEQSGQVLGTRMTPGTVRYRPALHRYRVVTDGCWTLVLSGPKVRDWGFYVPGLGWLRQREYFKRYGNGRAACE